MALLRPEPVELIHPATPAHLLIGWSILKDECWNVGDGLDLIRTIERRAGLQWRKAQRGYRALGGI
jgi:hypothetical protein